VRASSETPNVKEFGELVAQADSLRLTMELKLLIRRLSACATSSCSFQINLEIVIRLSRNSRKTQESP